MITAAQVRKIKTTEYEVLLQQLLIETEEFIINAQLRGENKIIFNNKDEYFCSEEQANDLAEILAKAGYSISIDKSHEYVFTIKW